MTLKTEDEAKQCWCAFARPRGSEAASNRSFGGSPEANAFCVGSRCMAWRWGSKPTKWSKVADDFYVPAEYGHGGYCGLSGKVES